MKQRCIFITSATLSIVKTLLVIFGITGDLSTRKLLPALSHIVNDHKGEELSVLGVSRRDGDPKQLVLEATHNQELADRTALFTMDMAEESDYTRLKDAMNAYDVDQRLVYLSVPPSAATQIVDFMGKAGITTPDVHLLFEKPFGFDVASAKDMIERTSRYFEESQLYRIDHYMAKEVAAELLRLRRNAETAQHHWGKDTVESVTIVASEKIGIEGRAQFYEQTGALRDFVQGHLMQLLSLVLMTRPTLDEQLPKQRLKALEALQPANPEKAIRAQYKGYDEEAQNPGSLVETFVALELFSSDPNWEGVPLRLVTGKALDEKHSYIEVQHYDGWSDIFEEGKVQPEEGQRQLDAYERVLLEAIAGKHELFTSSDEVIRSWELVALLQQHWEMEDEPPFKYEVGAHFTTIYTK